MCVAALVVEALVERTELDRVIHVVARAAIAIVIGELGEATDRGALVLGRLDVEVAEHAHLHMLGRFHMAVIHVGAGLYYIVIVGQAGAAVDRDGRIRHAVENIRRLGKAVEVDGVRIEQVGPLHHAGIGQGQEKVLAFLQHDRGRRKIVRQHAGGDRLILRHAGDVGETEHIGFFTVRHRDEAVARRQMHANGIWEVRIGPVRNCVGIIVTRALDERVRQGRSG